MEDVQSGDIYDFGGYPIVVLSIDKVTIRRTKGKVTHRHWVVYCDRYADLDNQLLDDFVSTAEKRNFKKIGNRPEIVDRVYNYVCSIKHAKWEIP